jgi:hypothetical protein
MFRGPFLVDGDEDEAGGRIGMSNFRILCVLFSYDDVVAYTTMFTAVGDTDAMWSEKAIDHISSRLHILGSYPDAWVTRWACIISTSNKMGR